MSNLAGNYKIGGGDLQGVDVLREREQERRARLQLLDDIREPSPQPIFGEPVKVELEDETSRRIKNTLGDFTQVLVNDPKNLIGISRSNSNSGHLMNGHSSNGYPPPGHTVNGYSLSSGSHSSHSSGYSSASSHSGSVHGSSGNSIVNHSSYSRTQPVKKPSYMVNGAGVPKTSMPNYISPKAPDKRPTYSRPDKTGYYKPESPVTSKTFHSSNSTQQTSYHGQESRPKDPASWDKDQRRTNSTNNNLAVNINVNLENSTNLTINNINVSNNSISTSAPIWNCGNDTPAVQIPPFHLPSNATPSGPAKTAANYGQTSTSYSSASSSVKHETQTNNTPAKRNTFRPSSLKIQPERKSVEAPIAVETILKEMAKVVPPAPLTAIQTPRTEETGFAFPTDPKDEESSFLKLEDQVHLLTPLGDDPMPNDVRQSSPNSWWTSPENKPEIKYNRADCKVTDSAAYELSKPWKASSNGSPELTPAPESIVVAPPEPLKPLGLESAQIAAEADASKYVSSSLQDDLEMSDSDEEVVPEVKPNPEPYLKSPVVESNPTLNNTTEVSTNNTTAMDTNSADSSSSSDSGDSDSDDSSSESNDSDSSSEASDEEISSKKWGLSNFVDESQRIHSPAFFHTDPATKETFRLHAERMKNFGLASLNPLNGVTVNQDALPSATVGGATFLVPDVPVTDKTDILLSPIPSPVHPTVGPRTPPSPSCPLKPNLPERNDDTEQANSHVEKKSSESNDIVAESNSPPSDETQVSCDVNEEKGSVQNEKCKKQLRSGKAKAEEHSSDHESAHADSFIDEPDDPKEPSDKPLENDNITDGIEKTISGSASPNISESTPDNYSIKTRQRVSAASTAKKTKLNVDNSSENSQKTEVAIAKLKHPRACRKSNEKQTKKAASTNVSAKSDLEEPKKQLKQDTKDTMCVSEKVKEPVKTPAKMKTIPKIPARSQNKASKPSPKQIVETKKSEVKKKKKKFSMENFLQSPETETERLSNTLPAFSPSPERSPIPECQNTSSEPMEESPPSPFVPAKAPGRPTSKSSGKGKKVEKLRRSVRCSERASNNAQAEALTTPQPNPENAKNPKTLAKAKRHIESLSISIEPPVELLSPIPQDPPVSTKVSDCGIPKKIMVCIPLSKLSRLPVSLQQNQESIRQQPKNNTAVDEVRMQKKDSTDKPAVNENKRSLSKDLNEKAKTIPPAKNSKTATKSGPPNKKAKPAKPLSETSSKSKAASDVNKNSIKVKDKGLGEASENKIPKKRKSDTGEKQSVKKPKLSSRTAEERKLKDQSTVLKADAGSNLETPTKSKGLERCDSTGSLSSLCSQQSQRSSKSSKEKKKDCPDGTPNLKRIKVSMSPLLSAKDIKQEKEDKSKNRCSLDARMQLDKSKTKTRDKATVKDMTSTDQLWDDCFSTYWDDQGKEDPKGKILGTSQSLETINRELADWDNLVPEMHKELKGASPLNKHNNQAPIMPMDYYWTEGKKQMHLAEKEKDPFQQAVKYFEAVVLFILTSQQREEYSKDTDNVYQFYSVTLKLTVKLLSKIKKLQSCPGSTEFKLLILCLKSQSLLNVKHYNLKIKEIKEELDGAYEFLKHHCSSALNPTPAPHQSRVTSLSNVPSPHSPIPSPASSVSSQNNSFSSNSVSVPQSILDMICRQHTHLVNLHKGHDLWEQADMYMTRSNLREFFKEVADQSEPLTLHSSITELVKYIQKGISLVKKSLR